MVKNFLDKEEKDKALDEKNFEASLRTVYSIL